MRNDCVFNPQFGVTTATPIPPSLCQKISGASDPVRPFNLSVKSDQGWHQEKCNEGQRAAASGWNIQSIPYRTRIWQPLLSDAFDRRWLGSVLPEIHKPGSRSI